MKSAIKVFDLKNNCLKRPIVAFFSWPVVPPQFLVPVLLDVFIQGNKIERNEPRLAVGFVVEYWSDLQKNHVLIDLERISVNDHVLHFRSPPSLEHALVLETLQILQLIVDDFDFQLLVGAIELLDLNFLCKSIDRVYVFSPHLFGMDNDVNISIEPHQVVHSIGNPEPKVLVEGDVHVFLLSQSPNFPEVQHHSGLIVALITRTLSFPE